MSKTFSFLIFIGLLAVSCYTNGQDKLSAVQFNELIKQEKSLQLVDVRTMKEYTSGYIAGSKHMDFYAPDFTKQLNNLDKSRPVALYCSVGGRSAQAAVQLKKMGFIRVYDLSGGLDTWKAQKLPLKKE